MAGKIKRGGLVEVPMGISIRQIVFGVCGGIKEDRKFKAVQRSLETVLGMRVRIRDRKGRGKIVIEYGTLEDFDRVVRMLKGK